MIHEGGGRVAVIGELNVDLIAGGLDTPPILGREVVASDFRMTLGSASAIFASGVAKLGAAVSFYSLVGDDDFGKFCRVALREAGVSDDAVLVTEGLKTGVTISLSTREDRALVTYLGAIADLRLERLPLDALAGHDHLHMTSYFLQRGLRDSFPRIFDEARSKGLTTSFDPNSDPDSGWGKDVWEVIRRTDVLFLNEAEAALLTRRAGAAESLEVLGAEVPCAVIKLGRKGAVAAKGGEVVSHPGFPVEASDTTGAGDSFAAGFVSGYVRGLSLRECLKIGNACGALSTLEPGGTAGQPTLERLRGFLGARHDEE
jgi:sugar/nucleoside kinase (ribokinase family)